MTHAAKALTILVIDDDTPVRRLVHNILEGRGYSVCSGSSAEEGFALFHKHSDRIGLLLTDLALPGKSGIELLWDLRIFKPSLPVVVMSGNLHEWDQSQLRGIPCLSKPFRTPVLLEKIERALANGTSG